jgi:hypothetical protein
LLTGPRSLSRPLVQRPHSASKVRWRLEARDTPADLVPGLKTQRRTDTVHIGGEIEMTERLRVFEDIATRDRTTNGRTKGIDIKKEIESGDGLVAPSRVRLHLEIAKGAQNTG